LFDKNIEEHYIKRGDPSKPTYYICRRIPDTIGLFSKYIIIMGHVRYALSNGWIPVVDMQNYPNSYLAPEKVGKENSWEYYFEQPLRVGLETAYNGENVILSRAAKVKLPAPGNNSMRLLEKTNNALLEWQMLVKLGLLKVKSELMEEILTIREKLFSPTDRVIGLHLRGTDYLVRQIKNRPIPPPNEFAAVTVRAKLKEWRCNKFFLATEDKAIVDVFKENFDDSCVILDKEYANFDPKKDRARSVCRIDRENDYFLQGKEYVTDMVLLSMCNAFIGARCAGTTAVALMGEKFENTYFFNLGRYGAISLD